MITKEGRKPFVRMTMLMEDEITLKAISRNPKQFTGKREPNRCREKKKNTLKKSRFTPYQTKTLETAYQVSSYLTKEAYQALAETVDLNIAQVRTWFNNRRKLRTHGKPREKTVKPGENLKGSIKVRDGKICPTSGWSPNQLSDSTTTLCQETDGSVTAAVSSNVFESQQLASLLEEFDDAQGEPDATCGPDVESIHLSDVVGQNLSRDSSSLSETGLSAAAENGKAHETETSQSGIFEGLVITSDLPTGSKCLQRPQSLSVREVEQLVRASMSDSSLPVVSPSMSADSVSGAPDLPSSDTSKDSRGIVAMEQDIELRWSCNVSQKSLATNQSDYEEAQLKFLKLAYEVHRYPSEEVVDALHVLTLMGKKEIADWFFEESLRRVVC
ncbi:uncharacterized protein [Apostichopus japonicus]